MIKCPLCGSGKYVEILSKKDVFIWTNASDDLVTLRKKHDSIINQCEACGHVYQPISDDLRKILNDVYLSNQAQGSTPLGKGNWGLERARSFLNRFLNTINLRKYKSAIEIGCANGYLLKYLKNNGFKNLVGIEPSISKTENKEGILFLKDFANENLILHQKYDLIFSVAVFEHIEEINSIIKFCKNNLSKDGVLYFSVPTTKRELENGDPALFLHQHVHYYTKDSLIYLLSKNGFKIDSIISVTDSLHVCAENSDSNIEIFPKVTLYHDYQEKLERILIKVENILRNNNTVVHGANNALNNILCWLNKDFHFTLVDNDNTKHGKRYFNKIVKCIEDIDLINYDSVLIIPTNFYEIIKTDYINKGFNGKIKGLFHDEFNKSTI